MLDAIFNSNHALRLSQTLRYLASPDFSSLALTGGIAIEYCLMIRGTPNIARELNDLDLIAGGFARIPQTIGKQCLIRHLHPDAPPGKMLLQAVYAPCALRVDIFRAYGDEFNRLHPAKLTEGQFQIVAFEDLLARHARLCCCLLRSEPIAPKYCRDFLRMLQGRLPSSIEDVWQEHRTPADPLTFKEVASLVPEAIRSRSDLLVEPKYSTDVNEYCPRCSNCEGFTLADPRQICDLLGYC